MSLINYPLQFNDMLQQKRLRVAHFTKPTGPVGVNGWSPVAQHEYGFSLIGLVASNPTGSGVAGAIAVDVYGSMNGMDFEKLTTLNVTPGAGTMRDGGHVVLSGVWPYVCFNVTAVGTAGTVVDGYAQPVAGNLN